MASHDGTNTEEPTEPPRKGRSNAILTYETVERILSGLQVVSFKIDHIRADFTASKEVSNDHETRIRALEQTITAIAASRGTATWIFQVVWPVAGVAIAALGYFTSQQ